MENTLKRKVKINIDYLTLRKYLGILGMILPLILILGNGFKVENSISHYYYTSMSVVFTGTLIAFGFFLISYKGYLKEENELFSDNLITNSAGILAFIVAIIPTACAECNQGVPGWHDDTVRSTIHLVCAGLFIISMGYMSFNQFVKSAETDELTKKRKRVYRICGIIIWGMVLFLLSEYIFKYQFSDQDTFWGESIALVAFGTAWLVKSKSLERFGL